MRAFDTSVSNGISNSPRYESFGGRKRASKRAFCIVVGFVFGIKGIHPDTKFSSHLAKGICAIFRRVDDLFNLTFSYSDCRILPRYNESRRRVGDANFENSRRGERGEKGFARSCSRVFRSPRARFVTGGVQSIDYFRYIGLLRNCQKRYVPESQFHIKSERELAAVRNPKFIVSGLVPIGRTSQQARQSTSGLSESKQTVREREIRVLPDD